MTENLFLLTVELNGVLFHIQKNGATSVKPTLIHTKHNTY